MLRHIATNSLVLIVQYGFGSLVPLLLIPYIVHEIGLANYGELAVAIAWATYGVAIVQYAFHISGPVRIAQLSPHESATHVFCSVVSAKLMLLILVLVVTIIVILGGVVINKPISLSQLLLILGLPLGWALHTGWYLQAIEKFTSIAFISIAGSALTLFLGFYLVSSENPNSVLAASIAMMLGPFVAGIGTLIVSVWHFRFEIGKLIWHSPWQELRESFHLFTSQFVATLYSSSGPIVIGMIAGVSQAGAYSVVERICTAIVGACLLVHVAAYPRLAHLYMVNKQAYRKLLITVIIVYLSVTLILAAVATAYLNSLQSFLFGAHYEQSQVALLASAGIWIILGIFGPALTGYFSVSGNGRYILPLTLKILVISICCGILGVFLWGAWAWLAALAISQTIVLLYGWQAWLKERF